MKEDRELQNEVEQRLQLTPDLHPADVGVSVQEGVVVLTGNVHSFAEREAAEESVLRTSGVLDVANELRIDHPPHAVPNDQEVAHAVRNALEVHTRLAHEQIKSSVSHGVVTLFGSVACWQDALEAEEAVSDLHGVEEVVDELVVRGRTG